MAVYKIFPEKDSSIYSYVPYMNAGLDPIMEIYNISPLGDVQTSRSLIKFPQDEINEIIDNKISGSNFNCHFRGYTAQSEGIIDNSKLEIFPIYGNWSNGVGFKNDDPVILDGVSWTYKDYNNGNQWITSSFPQYVTGSSSGGGNWFTGSNHNLDLSPTQSFHLRRSTDIDIDITDIIKVWYSSSKNINNNLTNVPNEGIILKWEDSLEFNSTSSFQPNLNIYSIDTNTIYPPSLDIKWDDSSYITGSLPLLTNNNIYIGLGNNPNKFYPDSVNKFRVNSRPMFPSRTYQTSSLYTRNYALPSSSYYAVKDLDTNEYVINFDENYTKISCDSSGSYFTLYMNGLEPERNYSILIKTIINGTTIIKDNNYYFKVIQE